MLGFAIIILLNILVGAFIVENLGSIQDSYRNKIVMDRMSLDLKECMLAGSDFRSVYDPLHVEKFQSGYYNLTRDIRDIEESDLAASNSMAFGEVRLLAQEYRNLILTNAKNPDSIENVWHSEHDILTRPGGLTDTASRMESIVAGIGNEKGDATGMSLLYVIQQNEKNYLQAHGAHDLENIKQLEEELLEWSGGDQELKQNIERYNVNLDLMASLYQNRASIESQIDRTVSSLESNVETLDNAGSIAFEDTLNKTMAALGITVLLSVMFSLIISIVVTGSISRPIVSLASISESIARGDLHKKIDVNSRDEVGKLADSFRIMVNSLRDRIEFNDTLLRSIVDAHVVMDNDYRILYFNSAAENMSGYSATEMVGKRCPDLFGLAIVGDHNHDKALDGLLHCKDGTTVDISYRISALKDANGSVAGKMIMIKDMAKERLAQREVARLKDFNENIVDTIKAVLIVLGPNDRIMRWNEYASEIFGKSQKDVAGKRLFDVVPSLKGGDFVMWMYSARSGGQEIVGREYRAVTGEDVCMFTVSIVPMHGGSVLIIMNDDTENSLLRKQLEKTNREMHVCLWALRSSIMSLPDDQADGAAIDCEVVSKV